MAVASTCVDLLVACHRAIRDGVLIARAGRDKEFHFQNWVAARLTDAGVAFRPNGRNSYPDFVMAEVEEGIEVKGLEFPGRWTSFDSNSQLVVGAHGGRSIFYAFGRYPKAVEGGGRYPVVDLVLCHGDFINAVSDYEHENKSVRGFGSYGDIMIRDRKMYVVRTPYALASGIVGQVTLIAPSALAMDERVRPVGNLIRREAETRIVGYSFNLLTNELSSRREPNAWAGTEHHFTAYRVADDAGPDVTLIDPETVEDKSSAASDVT